MVFSQQNITSFVRAKRFCFWCIHSSLNSYGWSVTIAPVGNLHSPQNKTVMAVGHFLVRFLCPASKIRIKWGVVRQGVIIYATLQWQVSCEGKGCLHPEPIMKGSQYCGERSLASCFCLQLTLELS